MKRITLGIVISVYLSFFINGFAFGGIKELDDLEGSFKDIERSMGYDSPKDMQLQKKYQLPQQKIKPFIQDLTPRDKPATDRAIIKNQERLKEMLDAQKRSLDQNLEDWGFKIPKKHRLIIEIFVITLFITFFSFLFYKRKVKKKEEIKLPGEDQGLDDDITFYKHG
ncbi:MAG: hypothetical protein ISS47_06685 [Candidatus Omnitrophica bacterium]|nr:hypothetical protein [Candidatus Omnitrophota bacterium]